MSRILSVILLLFFSFLPAQGQSAKYGLPNNAKVIEVQKLPAKPDRILILWMVKPKRYPRTDSSDPYTCPDETRGHCYSGTTRVSLYNALTKRIINTINIEDEHMEERTFDIPYKIHRGYYYVPGVKGEQEGKPVIMKLKDYNGDGRAEEFALFDAIFCMGLSTSLIGYSDKQDKVIQYETLLQMNAHGKKTSETVKWVDYLFSEKPLHTGFWKYQIDYRGRGGSLDKYEIRYNTDKERFEGTLTFEAAK